MKITEATYAVTPEARRLVQAVWALCHEGSNPMPYASGTRKIHVIKAIREITLLGLGEIKELVEVVMQDKDIHETVLCEREIET